MRRQPTRTTGRSPEDPIATGVFAFEGDRDTDLREPWSIELMLHLDSDADVRRPTVGPTMAHPED